MDMNARIHQTRSARRARASTAHGNASAAAPVDGLLRRAITHSPAPPAAVATTPPAPANAGPGSADGGARTGPRVRPRIDGNDWIRADIQRSRERVMYERDAGPPLGMAL